MSGGNIPYKKIMFQAVRSHLNCKTETLATLMLHLPKAKQCKSTKSVRIMDKIVYIQSSSFYEGYEKYK